MKVTPQGPLSISIHKLREMVAASPSFQRWTGHGNAAAAMASVHVAALPAPADGIAYTLAELQGYRPYVVVDIDRSGGGFTRQKVAEGAYEDRGKLVMFVEDDIDGNDADNYASAETPFMNNLMDLLDDIGAQSGSNGTLTIYNFRVQGPERADVHERETSGDYHTAIVGVEWGS